jgi:hypothetical protein
MRQDQIETILFAIVFALLLAVGALRCEPEPVESQERVSDQLALARICASEQGLRTDLEDCPAIYLVLERLAERRGWTFGSAARAYSRRVFDRSRSDARAWLAFLGPSGREPARWPAAPHMPWVAAQGRWRELYTRAGEILRGEVTATCDVPPDHWGCPAPCVDHERATRAGWGPVDCGRTRNEFWSVRRAGVN